MVLRPVPGAVIRPEYAQTGTPANSLRRSCRKDADGVRRIREACALAREVLEVVLAAVEPGISTDELDALCHRETVQRGAYPSPLNYRGFPKSLCTSINEVVCHGIPGPRRLVDGDIINCDVTAFYQGMHGDCSETVFVGTPSPAAAQLVAAAWGCMWAGIEQVRHGARFNAIGRACADHAEARGFGVVREFGGHGIGERFHMAPNVLHHFEPGLRMPMQAGMTFTVEPMLNAGGFRCAMLDDGWTAVTMDGTLSAQFEHTLLVTDAGYEVLTAGPDPRPFFQR